MEIDELGPNSNINPDLKKTMGSIPEARLVKEVSTNSNMSQT
jgi:hypothetical protein